MEPSPTRPASSDSSIERPFERWVREGSTSALAELFDAAAPRLLRLAIHLVGDTARAEDLVQSVFLVLLERRKTLDPAAPGEAWLLRVLHNKVIDQRRAQRRGPRAESGPAALEAAIESGFGNPGDLGGEGPIERRELAGAVAAAIDGLRPPYREVLIARLRHGASPAEIAHLLDRSPGQVRVQLHRGLELLRTKLPEREALAAVWFLGVPGALGGPTLEGVRQVILSTASAPASSSYVPVFVTAMLKPLAGTAAVLLLFLAAWTVGRDPGTSVAPTLGVPGTMDLVAAASGGTGPGEVPGSGEPAREVLVVPDANQHTLVGALTDAETGEPIMGAHVRCIRRDLTGARWDSVALKREFPALLSQGGGQVGPAHSSDWPSPEHVERRLLARPLDPHNEVAVEAVTDASGRYEFSVPRDVWSGSLVEVESDGYGPRLRPLPAPVEKGKAVLDVALYRPYRLQGRLVSEAPLPSGLTVSVHTSAIRQPWVLDERGVIDPSCIEALGAWQATADARGHFALDVFGSRPYVSITTPGWDGSGVAERGAHDGPLEIAVTRVTRLVFLDDESGEPVEDVSLTLMPRGGGRAHLAGRYDAPRGAVQLDERGGYLQSLGPMDLTAWSLRHEPITLRIAEFLEPRDHVVRMTVGETPQWRGRALRGDEPVVGLLAQLFPVWSKDWHAARLPAPLASTRTGADGGFRLEAPAGVYLLALETPTGDVTHRRVQVPNGERKVIDLAQVASVHVHATTSGVPATGNCVAILMGSDGRNDQKRFDAQGRATFTALPPGEYTVDAYDWDRMEGHDPARKQRIELRAKEEVTLEFDLTPRDPVRVWIEHGGTTDFTGWRYRPMGSAQWGDVAHDGALGPDGSGSVEVESPRGQRFGFFQDRSMAREQRVRLDRGRCGYRGVVLDEQGQPVPGLWVTARPPFRPGQAAERTVGVGVKTDAEGRFILGSLEVRRYRFRFQAAGERRQWVKSYQGLRFEPEELPGQAGSEPNLVVRMATSKEGVAVQGTVVGPSGDPVEAVIHVEVLEEARGGASGGVLLVGGDRVETDLMGHFEMQVTPEVPCRLSVYGAAPGQGLLATQELIIEGGHSPRPLTLRLHGPESGTMTVRR